MPFVILSDQSVAISRRRSEKRAAVWSPLQALWCHVRIWRARVRQRKALANLDDRLLYDVGISREQAVREVAKPFWVL